MASRECCTASRQCCRRLASVAVTHWRDASATGPQAKPEQSLVCLSHDFAGGRATRKDRRLPQPRDKGIEYRLIEDTEGQTAKERQRIVAIAEEPSPERPRCFSRPHRVSQGERRHGSATRQRPGRAAAQRPRTGGRRRGPRWPAGRQVQPRPRRDGWSRRRSTTPGGSNSTPTGPSGPGDDGPASEPSVPPFESLPLGILHDPRWRRRCPGASPPACLRSGRRRPTASPHWVDLSFGQ